MSKEINLNNKYRVLLTEVLPYELPLMLDNEGFYQNMQDKSLQDIFKETCPWHSDQWTIPFDYSVRKYGGDKSRKLSLMHPFSQLQWVNFYEKHDYCMLALCNNSPFSIRYIANRSKCIFKAEEDDTENSQNLQKRVEVLDGEIEKRYRSYFGYKRYDMMYKFKASLLCMLESITAENISAYRSTLPANCDSHDILRVLSVLQLDSANNLFILIKTS